MDSHRSHLSYRSPYLHTLLLFCLQRPPCIVESSIPQRMNFFALPDVFLRRVMKTVSIRDRMRLRLVSRSFERLVASTHAGYFSRVEEHALSIFTSIGGEALRSVIPRYELEQYLTHWNHLFSGITVADFQYYLNETFDLAALRKFTSKFKIRVIESTPSGNEHLDRCEFR
ncbi:hypothetical protein PRIPAC_79911 [Pristionchus pacificus]|uniref:F-box domain-containing protein n=1 Tax=Pristionchus pacificus TaxID=54126 RepID=A0A2A6BY04_PRIPA|nr:hypothetical protein PRIPAC_79911 [Pristionchus pacificus]|eukprot:PDM70749.1 F-box domain-containing protein [Pristionchus pacificus]